MRNQIPKERHHHQKWQNSNPSLIPRPPCSLVPSNTGLKGAPGLSPQHQLLTDRQGDSTTHFPYRSPRRFNNTFPNVSCTLTSPSPGFALSAIIGQIHFEHIACAASDIPGLNKTGLCDCGANNLPARKQSSRR